MKYIVAALALAASAVAAPSERRTEACTFGTYECSSSTGIQVCDIDNTWKYVGDCGAGEVCKDLDQNGYTLPFCTKPTEAVEKRNGRPGQSPGEKCSTPGKYDCFGPYAIQVCNTQNVLELVGDCPQKTHCSYLYDIPFCVDSV